MAGGEALRERMARLENFIGTPQTDDALSLSVQMERTNLEIVQVRDSVNNLVAEMEKRFNGFVEDMTVLADAVKGSLKSIEGEITVMKQSQSVSSGASTSQGPLGSTVVPVASKIKVPDPKPFDGKRSSKELENFLWDMEQYFKAAHIPEIERVTITSMYLSGDAKLWWRTRTAGDASVGRPVIETWETLKKELKDQFLPSNSAWQARDALRRLKHTGSVRDYVKEFSSLMLDIKNMAEEDKLFNFMSGLQNWAQMELRRQGVRDLSAAMAAADALVDYQPLGSTVGNDGGNKEKHKGKDKKAKEKFTFEKHGGSVSVDKMASSSDASSAQSKSKGCFICDGPHRARDCPKKGKLNALVAEEGESSEEEPLRVNPIQLLNAMQVEEPKSYRSVLVGKGSGKGPVGVTSSGAPGAGVSSAK